MLNWKCINKKTQNFRSGFLSGASRSSPLYTPVLLITLLYMLQDNCTSSSNYLNSNLHWKNIEHILELNFYALTLPSASHNLSHLYWPNFSYIN